MKILIVKTSSMGDIIHALPVARDIRKALPDAEIHWISEESFKDIPSLAPSVSKVHVTAFRRWRKSLFSNAVRSEMRVVKEALRAEKYDLVLDIQGLIRSGIVSHWTGVPSTGYTWGTAREPLATLFYTHKLDLPESLGAVKRYRMAAARALGYEIDTEKAVFGLEASCEPSVRVDGDYAGLAVNTSRDEKLWPDEHWVVIGKKLLAEKGWKSVLFWGNETERERVERIAREIPESIVAPRTGLAQTAATLAGASVVIGVDTGLAHLGAALGRPSVGIFVSTPTDTLKLIGDGEVTSLGGIGKCPTTSEIWNAVEKVTGKEL